MRRFHSEADQRAINRNTKLYMSTWIRGWYGPKSVMLSLYKNFRKKKPFGCSCKKCRGCKGWDKHTIEQKLADLKYKDSLNDFYGIY